MTPKFLSLLGAILISGPGHAAEDPARVLSKIGKWSLNSNGRVCELSGTFGESSDPTLLTFTKYLPSKYFDLTIIGLDPDSIKISSNISVAIGGATTSRRADWEFLAVSNGRLGLKMPSLGLEPQSAGPDSVPTVQTPTVDSIGLLIDGKSLHMRTGALEVPLQALNKCTDELLKNWGYDPVQQSALASRPRPTNYPGDWVKRDDYPPAARRAGVMGTVWFLLDIDSNGRIADCQILAATAPTELQVKTCDLMRKRARFAPAVDRAGSAVRSYYANKVRWAP